MSKSIYFILGGIILGALGGFAYWHFVGCDTGSCPITSIWYHSTGYGALMGGLLGNIFIPKNKQNDRPESENQESGTSSHKQNS